MRVRTLIFNSFILHIFISKIYNVNTNFSRVIYECYFYWSTQFLLPNKRKKTTSKSPMLCHTIKRISLQLHWIATSYAQFIFRDFLSISQISRFFKKKNDLLIHGWLTRVDRLTVENCRTLDEEHRSPVLDFLRYIVVQVEGLSIHVFFLTRLHDFFVLSKQRRMFTWFACITHPIFLVISNQRFASFHCCFIFMTNLSLRLNIFVY